MRGAKLLGWVESEEPLWRGFGGFGHQEMEDLIGRLAQAAFLVRGETTRRIKDGLATRPADLKGDFGHLGEELYRDTYPAFRQAVGAAAELIAVPDEGDDDDRTDHIRLGWTKTLEQAALAVFDRHVPVVGSAGGEIRRRVKARYDLAGFLRGVTKVGGTQLFEKALDLPSPQKQVQHRPGVVHP